MNALDKPLYVSRRSRASLGQEYRIYQDRIELQCWVAFHTLVIRPDDILTIEVRPAPVFADYFRGKGFVASVLPLKIDLADMHSHVAMTKRSKLPWMRHIRFTPDDPELFVAVCESIMEKSG